MVTRSFSTLIKRSRASMLMVSRRLVASRSFSCERTPPCVAFSCPISASRTAISRLRVNTLMPSRNTNCFISGGSLCAIVIARRRRVISASKASSSRVNTSRSAPVSVGSSSTSTSPASTRRPFSTAIVKTRPGSNVCTVLDRPLGWIRPCATAWISISPK